MAPVPGLLAERCDILELLWILGVAQFLPNYKTHRRAWPTSTAQSVKNDEFAGKFSRNGAWARVSVRLKF